VVQVVGKHAYVADATGGFLILDISGIETPSLYAGSIQANDLTITENVDVANNLYIRNGLNVGPSGIFTDGRLSIGGVSYFGAKVGIGTTTPSSSLEVANGTTTTTITIGSAGSGKGGCLKIRDTDDGGWTYCSVLDGTLTCGTASCE